MMRMDKVYASNHEDESADLKEADKMIVKRLHGGEVDMMTDQESTAGSSSEETESPRSVLVKGLRRWTTSYSKEKNMAGSGEINGMSRCTLHNQILRIRYEDSHVGEDISEALSLFSKDDHHLASMLVFSKPILPSSPLGGKTIIKTSSD